MRRPEWKQANPKDQLIAVLAAAAGFASNLSAGIYKKADIAEKSQRLEELLEQAVELTAMVNGRWPKQPVDANKKLEALSAALTRKNIISVPGKTTPSLHAKNFFISFVDNWYITEHRFTGNRKQFKRISEIVFYIDRHTL